MPTSQNQRSRQRLFSRLDIYCAVIAQRRHESTRVFAGLKGIYLLWGGIMASFAFSLRAFRPKEVLNLRAPRSHLRFLC